MSVIDLATVEQVKGYLGINSSADDPLFERLVTAASRYIQTWLNRELGAGMYVSVLNGTGGDTLLFPNYPVTAVSAVTIDGQSIPESAGAFLPGYVWDENSVSLRGHIFTRGKKNVSLSYTAGYMEAPAELTQACVELVSMRYREKDRIGLQSKGLAGEQTTYSLKDMPDSVKTILRNYRKVGPW